MNSRNTEVMFDFSRRNAFGRSEAIETILSLHNQAVELCWRNAFGRSEAIETLGEQVLDQLHLGVGAQCLRPFRGH